MHTVHLGIAATYCCHTIWELITANMYGLAGTDVDPAGFICLAVGMRCTYTRSGKSEEGGGCPSKPH
jgi:hypothetical protein